MDKQEILDQLDNLENYLNDNFSDVRDLRLVIEMWIEDLKEQLELVEED